MTTLLVDRPTDGVTRITLNRPEKLNALNAALVSDLHDALADVATDASCRVVVLTGSGRGFCAGVDLGGYGQVPNAESLDRVEGVFSDYAAPSGISVSDPTISAGNMTISATYNFNFILPNLLPYGPLALTSQVAVPLI
jgi:enoyl-CoA hydratase/carnithine racemase